ncbi:MAG: Inner rane CreD family protein [Verrucomicrobia bacterium]|nr:Inner rane CreD family protein [Verrucomicrobiota bacterium]
MDTPEPPLLPSPAQRRLSLFLKIGGIALLIVLLHIPLAMMNGVLAERQNYQAQATDEIAGIWGRRQLVTGPVLAIPYAYKTQVIRSRVVNGRAVQVEESDLANAVAYFLPETLNVTGAVSPEVRHRGIYDTVVYSTKMKLAGQFQPDFAAAGIEADQVDWEKARVLMGVSDLHGIRSMSAVKFADGKEAPFEASDAGSNVFLPLGAKISMATGAKLEFSMEVALQGSERLEIAPVGKITSTALQSTWPDPSFIGASLPAVRQVSDDGFKAEWQTFHFSRGFPQSWTSRLTKNEEMAQKIGAASFGVRFAQPVAGYNMAGRAQKYGVLFFVLVFAVFFLFEVTAGLKIHPLQYLLVGVGLCLFFLGFLALSEFWPTGLAYAIAAAACTLLVSLYAWSFLETGWRTLVIVGGLGATYGYLYFVLKSQDYALVAGTAALFGALALVMFCTRRINWYELDLPGTPNAGRVR